MYTIHIRIIVPLLTLYISPLMLQSRCPAAIDSAMTRITVASTWALEPSHHEAQIV